MKLIAYTFFIIIIPCRYLLGQNNQNIEPFDLTVTVGQTISFWPTTFDGNLDRGRALLTSAHYNKGRLSYGLYFASTTSEKVLNPFSFQSDSYLLIIGIDEIQGSDYYHLRDNRSNEYYGIELLYGLIRNDHWIFDIGLSYGLYHSRVVRFIFSSDEPFVPFIYYSIDDTNRFNWGGHTRLHYQITDSFSAGLQIRYLPTNKQYFIAGISIGAHF